MSPLTALSATPSPVPAGPARSAESPEEAARQFESVLVRQFVEVMTRDLFKAGAEGGMLTGQADLQRDTLTDVLTEHLVDSGTFGVADLMMRQWTRAGRVSTETPAEAPADASPAPVPPPAPPPATPAPGPFLDAPSDGPSAFDSLPDLS